MQKEKADRAAMKAEQKRTIIAGYKALRLDPDTGHAREANVPWDSEKECFTCFSQFGAWQEAGFPELHFPWKKCLGCRQSMCPRCWEVKSTMADHQAVCRAREQARKAKSAAEAAKVKAMAEAAAKAKATAEPLSNPKPLDPRRTTHRRPRKPGQQPQTKKNRTKKNRRPFS